MAKTYSKTQHGPDMKERRDQHLPILFKGALLGTTNLHQTPPPKTSSLSDSTACLRHGPGVNPPGLHQYSFVWFNTFKIYPCWCSHLSLIHFGYSTEIDNGISPWELVKWAGRSYRVMKIIYGRCQTVWVKSDRKKVCPNAVLPILQHRFIKRPPCPKALRLTQKTENQTWPGPCSLVADTEAIRYMASIRETVQQARRHH